jgi:hypothetical protein
MTDLQRKNDDDPPEVDWLKFDIAGDPQATFNLSDWVQWILKKHGATITDTGYGFGGADIGFEHRGAKFFLSIKPRLK